MTYSALDHLDSDTGEAGEHPYESFVNPRLGRTLTQLALNKSYVRGEGCYLYDSHGRRYLDFLAQYGALPFGFNHPHIWRAVEAMRVSMEPMPGHACMAGAPPLIAQWSTTHPAWRVARWRCGIAGAEGYRI